VGRPAVKALCHSPPIEISCPKENNGAIFSEHPIGNAGIENKQKRLRVCVLQIGGYGMFFYIKRLLAHS
jgi:hypothetical protein